MRWSIPKMISRRGAGLGNEVLPWAKAYLGSKALGLRLIDPPWRINARRYDRELDIGKLDVVSYAAIRALPSVDISTEMLIECGEYDYFEAVTKMASSLRSQRAAAVLHSSGMHGGYLGIRRARPFLKRQLLGAKHAIAAAEQIVELVEPTLRVGVHIRGGDFGEIKQVKSGVFNEQLPISWSVEVLKTLAAELDIGVRVFLATDTPSAPLADAFTHEGRRPEMLATNSIGDLSVLAECDIIISSVSSFSMLAIFLSDAFYVWHEDQLGAADGWLSIWGHEGIDSGGGRTQRAIADQSSGRLSVRRGIPQGSRPVWPSQVLQQLEFRARSRRWSDDLLYYGVARAGSNGSR